MFDIFFFFSFSQVSTKHLWIALATPINLVYGFRFHYKLKKQITDRHLWGTRVEQKISLETMQSKRIQRNGCLRALRLIDPLLLMSSPCNRPSESFCTISDRWCGFFWGRWWIDMLDWEPVKFGNCMFWWPTASCGGIGRKVDAVYGMWCICKLNDSDGFTVSPVAIFSLSTSFIRASLRAVWYWEHHKFQQSFRQNWC